MCVFGKKFVPSILILSLVVTVLMAAPRPVQAGATITVNTFDDTFKGSKCSLRDAIQAANTDLKSGGCPAGSGTDTIILPKGTYTLSQPGGGDGYPGEGDLNILANVAIIGEGTQGDNLTLIDASGLTARAIQIQPKKGGITVRLSNLVISGGKMPAGNGGAILNGFEDLFKYVSDTYASLTLDKVVIDGSQAGTADELWVGGGIFNGIGCKLTVNGSTISNNQAGYGGGIFNYGSLVISNSTISGNSAWELGGGVVNFPYHSDIDRATLTGATISSNSVTGYPLETGGLYSDGTLTVQNSTITGNDGAGLEITSGSKATVSGTTFSKQAGYGMRIPSGASATINGSTFTQNDTGLLIQGSTSSASTSFNRSRFIQKDTSLSVQDSATVFITTSTFSGNRPAAQSAAGIDSAGNLSLTSSTVSDNSGGGVFLKGGSGTFTNVQVNGNAGTGVRVDGGVKAVIQQATVSNNKPSNSTSAAGIDSRGDLTIKYSTISRNTGTGLRVNPSVSSNNLSVTSITNSTIAENTSAVSDQGIGIDNTGELHLLNITLANNSGVGLFLENASIASVQNSILATQNGSNCAKVTGATYTSLGHNLFYPNEGQCPLDAAKGDLTGDPLLESELANNGGATQTYAISSADSLAVDAIPASGAGCPPADQRLFGRPADGKGNGVKACDIGAYEYLATGFIDYLSLIRK